MLSSKKLECAAALIIVLPASGWAQDASAVCACEHRSAVSVTAWFGVASTSQHLWLGYVDDARMDELGVGVMWSHPIARAAAVEAGLTLFPYMGFRRPSRPSGGPDQGGQSVDFSSTTSARGVGFVPLDVGVRGFTQSRVIASAGAFFGLVWFNGPVPNASAERRNYLFGLRGGVEVPLDPRNYLFAGARVQHLSNGGTRPANEGVENMMFRFGYGFNLRR